VEVEQQNNGASAVFLENEYDVDQIADMVQLIYTWMRTQKSGDRADTVRLSPETLQRVYGPRGLQRENRMAKKNHMKETQVLLQTCPWWRWNNPGSASRRDGLPANVIV
jgi:hypothetical protein